MSDEEIFFKYIKGYRCSREEYLRVRIYLNKTSIELRNLYESNMEIIIRSLIKSKDNESIFLAKTKKYGLTVQEALSLINDYVSKQESEISLTFNSRK